MKKAIVSFVLLISINSYADSAKYKVYYPIQSSNTGSKSGVIITQESSNQIIKLYQCRYYLNSKLTEDLVIENITESGIEKYLKTCNSLDSIEVKDSGGISYSVEIKPVSITPYTQLYSATEKMGSSLITQFTLGYSKLIDGVLFADRIQRKGHGVTVFNDGRTSEFQTSDILAVIATY